MKPEIKWDEVKNLILQIGAGYGGRPKFVERKDNNEVVFQGSLDNFAHELTSVIFKVASSMQLQRPWQWEAKYILQAYHCRLITKEECRAILGFDEIKDES